MVILKFTIFHSFCIQTCCFKIYRVQPGWNQKDIAMGKSSLDTVC